MIELMFFLSDNYTNFDNIYHIYLHVPTDGSIIGVCIFVKSNTTGAEDELLPKKK